jgi:hypothetical protein
MYSDRDTHRWVGCPIRISMDQRLLAAPHGFSQRATSFIASWCQGIHRTPFSCSQLREHKAEALCSHLAQEPSNLPLGRQDNKSHPRAPIEQSSMGSLLCRPSLPSCENNCADQDERAIKHIHSQYASEHFPVAGIRCSRTSSGQTCNRRVQTRQTLIHMSKEQNQSSKED